MSSHKKIHLNNYEELANEPFVKGNFLYIFNKINNSKNFESMDIDINTYENLLIEDKYANNKYTINGNYKLHDDNEYSTFTLIYNITDNKLNGEYTMINNSFKNSYNYTTVYYTYYRNDVIKDVEMLINNNELTISSHNEEGIRYKLYKYEYTKNYLKIDDLFREFPLIKIDSCWYNKKIFINNLFNHMYSEFKLNKYNVIQDNMLIMYNGFNVELERLYFSIPYMSVYWKIIDNEKVFIKTFDVIDPLDLTISDIEY